jgi:hypothetical protein
MQVSAQMRYPSDEVERGGGQWGTWNGVNSSKLLVNSGAHIASRSKPNAEGMASLLSRRRYNSLPRARSMRGSNL